MAAHTLLVMLFVARLHMGALVVMCLMARLHEGAGCHWCCRMWVRCTLWMHKVACRILRLQARLHA
eukprot:8258225-Alexandrium_andersonii.AAC.1